MKTCPRCNEPNETYKNRAVCKVCIRKEYREKYRSSSYNKEVARRASAKSKQRAKQFVLDYKQTHCCKDCGESNPVVLQFHHYRGEKYKDLAWMVQRGLGLNTIKKEISKCVLLCANCHIKRHVFD